MLQLSRPGAAHSIHAWWADGSDDLAGWYVNLQQPLRRTRLGFDTRDDLLDIVVEPDLSSWYWKDEDDLAEAERIGLLSAEEAAAIHAEGERVIGLIDKGTPPFDPAWADWRPDPAWRVPELPAGWDQV